MGVKRTVGCVCVLVYLLLTLFNYMGSTEGKCLKINSLALEHNYIGFILSLLLKCYSRLHQFSCATVRNSTGGVSLCHTVVPVAISPVEFPFVLPKAHAGCV